MKILTCTLAIIFYFSQHSLSQTDLIVNGDFTNSSGWVFWGTPQNFYITTAFACSSSAAGSLPGYCYLGTFSGGYLDNASGGMYQNVTIPANAISATLTYKVSVNTNEITTATEWDILYTRINNVTTGGVIQVTNVSNLDGGTAGSCQSYQQKSFTFSPTVFGQTVQIGFQGITDASRPTMFRIDDVHLIVTTSNCTPITSSYTISNQTVTSPTSAFFNVVASGTSILYQWEYSINSGINWNNVPNISPYNGATSSSLTINPTSNAMNGYLYRCALVNNCTPITYTNWATLNVNSSCIPITSTYTISNQSITAPASTFFSVTASGTSISYQWEYSINGGSNWNNVPNNSPYSGASSSTLSINPSSSSMTGYLYRCSLFNNCTAINVTNWATLTVNSTCIAPSLQASNILFSNVSTSQLTVDCSSGNGDKRIIVINSSNNFTSPLNGTDPTANSNYSGLGEQVIFNGIGNSVTVTGLTSNTNYWFRVFEANCSGANSFYNVTTSSNNPISQLTQIVLPTINTLTFTNSIQNHSGITALHTLYSGTPFINNNPIKICADGSTSTYIKVNVSNPTGIGFRLLDELNQPISDINKYGQIGSINIFGNDVEVSYTHPQYMDWNSLSRPMILQVIYNGVPINGIAFPIEIYRAPVMMIHGFFANTLGGTTFDHMENELINFYTLYPAALIYKKHYPDFSSFNDNKYALRDGINDLFIKARNDNFSIGAADVVAHSMGGLLSRIYIQGAYGTQYRNDVHKLITLNTPHSGSPFPNYLLSNCVSSLLYQWPIYSSVTCGSLVLFPAISNMGVNSNSMDDNLNGSSVINTNRVPTYAIITTSLDPNDGGYGHIFYNLPGYIEHFNGENHDVIVSESSQQGGISSAYVLNGQWHVGTANNPTIISRVKDILNAIPNDINFDIDGYSPPDLNFRIPRDPVSNIIVRFSNSDSIYINSPASSTNFNPGDSVYVNVIGTPTIEKIIFAAGNQNLYVYAKDTLMSSCSFQYIIPEDAIGEIRIIAIGSTITGDLMDFDTLRINILPPSFDSIASVPNSIFLAACSNQSISIKGYYNNGLSKDITFTNNLLCQIADTNIASYASPNVLTGKQTGSTFLIVSYLGLTTQIPIQVYLGEDWFTATIDNNSPILCQGENVRLTASLGDSYLWNTGDTTQSIIINNSGQYFVTVGNTCGMIDISDTMNVLFHSLPTSTVVSSGPNSFCQGDSVILSVSNSTAIYNWSNGENTQVISINTTGNYVVTVTDTNGCSSTSIPISVIVNPNPLPLISGPNAVCPNSNGIIYTIPNSSNLLQWGVTGAHSFIGQGTDTIAIDWDSLNLGSVYVEETDPITGCFGVATLNVNISPTLNPTIVPTGPVTICQGESLLLDAGSGFNSYLWNNGATTQNILVNVAGNYSVNVTSNGCSGSSSTLTTISIVIPQNLLPISLVYDTMYSPYSLPCNWYILGDSTPVDTREFYICREDTNYFVVGIDVNGCIAASDIINCTPTSIKQILNSDFNIYPNPTNGKINIFFGKQSTNCTIEIINIMSQSVYLEHENSIPANSTKELDLNISKGTYLIRLIMADELIVRTLIIN